MSKPDSLDLQHYYASLWETEPKCSLATQELGSVLLLRDLETVYAGDDDDEEDDSEGVKVWRYRIAVPFSSDLSNYKFAGEGFLCRVIGSDRPSIAGFRHRDEPEGVRLCVALFKHQLQGDVNA